MKRTKLLHEAAHLAIHHHHLQERKHCINEVSLPYVSHPFDVMKKLWVWRVHDAVMLAAALMHDTLEDTDITPDEIRKSLGEPVLSLVKEMTYRKPSGVSKEEARRAKAGYIAGFDKKSIEAVVLKVADRVSNVMDYLLYDPEYAMVYFHKADVVFNTFRARKAEVAARFGETTTRYIDLTLKALGSHTHPQDMKEGS